MNELYHYGVKGMKWGVRRAKKAGTKYSRKAQKQIDANMSNAKARKMDVSTINSDEVKKRFKNNRAFVQKLSKKGKTYINNNSQFMNMSIMQANQFAMQEATRASINASLQVASLGLSGGTNPFMLGVI